MPICVMTTPNSLPLTKDEDIIEILDDVNGLCKGKYYVAEYSVKRKQWFREDVGKKMYELYYDYGMYDLQLINHGGGASSINTMVDKTAVMAYLYGFYDGYKDCQREAKSKEESK